MTGCYDDENGPCVKVTIQFANHTSQPITVDGYRITWPGLPIAPGLPDVGKNAPEVHFRLEPGAVQSRSIRVQYLAPDMNALHKRRSNRDPRLALAP
jgi:hypothetical protein